MPSLHPHPDDQRAPGILEQLLISGLAQIHCRGVQSDQLVVDCTVEELVEQWPAIVEALNPKG